MKEEKLVFDGWHKITLVEAIIKGQTVQREKLLINDSVGALVVDENNQVGLVRQYRPTVGEYLWEIPAGVMDKALLTPTATLIEELYEECEIKPEEILNIQLEPIEEYYMMAGSSDAIMRIYRFDVTAQTDKQVSDVDVEEVKWFTVKEIKTKLQNKEIKDSKTKLALNHFLLAQ